MEASRAKLLWLMLVLVLVVDVEAATEVEDTKALQAVKKALVDPRGELDNWVGNDPCSRGWIGVYCGPKDGKGVQRVEELRLLRMGLHGVLAWEIGSFTNLKTLNMMWNSIEGGLPASVANLTMLQRLLVSGNQFSGRLPPQLGKLRNLIRLQIDENRFDGSIPVELSQLSSLQHMHMNNNSLTGWIPTGLGAMSSVLHILMDNNLLQGMLPEDLTNISTLLVLQLDNNPFARQTIPPSYARFPSLLKLSLRTCNLVGPIPDFRTLPSLQYLDLSDNSLTGSLPNLTGLLNVITVALSHNRLAQNMSGVALAQGSLPMMQAFLASDNQLSGVVDVTALTGGGPYGQQRILDLQNNELESVTPTSSISNVTVLVAGNAAICGKENASGLNCMPQSQEMVQAYLEQLESPSPIPVCNVSCSSMEVPNSINGSCYCALPLTFTLRLKSPSFTVFAPYELDFRNKQAQQLSLLTNGTLSPENVRVLKYTWEHGRVLMNISFFPDGKTSNGFSTDQWRTIYTLYVRWNIRDFPVFGPYEFLAVNDTDYSDSNSSPIHLHPAAIAGIVLGVTTILGLTVALGVALFAIHQLTQKIHRRGTPTLHLSMGRKMDSRVKVDGVREVMLQEVEKATEGFSEKRLVGQGSYGKVYRGTLDDGQEVAIKRAEEGSFQGEMEFVNEIHLLSRVHHRNLVRLVGYCEDQGEQMLLYEYMAGGSVAGQISGMGLRTRVGVALGSARGLAYLHTEANPPVFHRDIKAANILLDAKGVAKVADFGLSKLAPALMEADGTWPALAYAGVSTAVKGTPGYMDPEYFLTHMLTDKSDVYSFGVLLMELLTGRPPIWQGMNIVRQLNAAYSHPAVSNSLESLLDSRFKPACLDPNGSVWVSGIHPLLRLAFSCCKDNPNDRPAMLEVVRQLEDIWLSIHPDDKKEQDLDLDQAFAGPFPRGESSSSSHHSSRVESETDTRVVAH